MPRVPKKAQTDGSTTFDPDIFFDKWSKEELTPPYDNNFRRFIIRSFGLPIDDDYGYQATTEVSLLQAQTYIEFGAQGGLHAWYRDEEGKEVCSMPPHILDIVSHDQAALNAFPETYPSHRGRYSGVYRHLSIYDEYGQGSPWTGSQCEEGVHSYGRCEAP
jgi:hypothetical protein